MMEVRIQNFQAIKDSGWVRIEGFTALVGRTNTGKSSFLRAIKCALENARGQSFVRKGEKFAEVHIKAPDLDLLWQKGKGVTTYIINGKKMEKVAGIPKEIEDAGFRRIKIGEEHVWAQIATQFDPIFLLNKPGTQVAELVCRAARLDVYSAAIRKCASLMKEEKSRRNLRDADRAEAKAKLDAMASLPEALADVRKLEDGLAAIQSGQAEVEGLERDWDECVATAKTVGVLTPVAKVSVPEPPSMDDVSDVVWLEEMHAAHGSAAQAVETLRGVPDVVVPEFRPVSEQDTELRMLEGFLETYDAAHHAVTAASTLSPVVLPKLPDLDEVDEIVYMENLMAELVSSGQQAKIHQRDIESLEGRIAEASADTASLREELGDCPLCGAEFHEEKHA